MYFAPLYNEYLQRETIWWNRILDIKCHTKKTDWTNFAHAGLNAIHNPSSTVSFKVRSSPMNKQTTQQTNKQIKTTTTTILTHLSKRKVFFMEKTFSQRVQWRWTFQGGLLYQFWGPPTLPQRKSLSPQQYVWSSTPSINRNFAGKYIRQALLKHWNVIDKSVRLKNDIPQATHDSLQSIREPTWLTS